MKSIAIFRVIALCTAALFIFQSCRKGNSGQNCLAYIKADTLCFNVVDKNTGENLFFSNTPLYTTDQISFLINDMMVQIKPRVESSTSGQKNFFITVGSGQKNGIIKGYIDSKPEYTIDYFMKEDKSSECPQYILDKIVINANQQEENLKDRVVLLKK